VSAVGYADSSYMMRFFKKHPRPSLNRELSTVIECAVCGENRVDLMDARCVSCILGEMGAGRGGDVSRKFSPRGQESRSGNVAGRMRVR
jgi:hypothetical protein